MAVIQVEHLVKRFQSKRKPAGFAGSLRALWRPEYLSVEAVRDISFTVEAGERLAFIGPNGAGKSTTIKMLVGILFPTAGTAKVLGCVPWVERQHLAYQIGSVFGQKSQLWFHLPPVDTFNLFARIYEVPPSDFAPRLRSLVDLFEIGPYLETPVRKLSLGERMRCELVASLLHRPRVLFLDEPTIGLDVVVKQQIRDLLLRMCDDEGVTLFLTSHDAGDVETLCRRAIVINQGTTVYDGRVSHLKREYIQFKQIDLKLRDEFTGFEMPGVRVVKHTGYGVKLEVDTRVVSIEAAMQAVMARYGILDMEVSPPPMEAIIRQIYQETGTAREGTLEESVVG